MNKIIKQSEIIKVIRIVSNVKEMAFRYFYRLAAIDSQHICVQQWCALGATCTALHQIKMMETRLLYIFALKVYLIVVIKHNLKPLSVLASGLEKDFNQLTTSIYILILYFRFQHLMEVS